MNALFIELGLQLREELVDHRLDHFSAQRIELNDCVEAIAELRREHTTNDLHRVACVILMSETD